MPPLHLHSEQPFGMVAGQITVGQERDVTVYPAVGSVRRPIEDELLAWIADGLRSRDRGDEEIAHLRRYRPGDALHRIHWRASARHRGLLVSERQAPEARRLALLLDCCCSGRSHRLERSIAVAATLVDHLLARGWTISLHAPGLPREGMVGDRDQLMGGLAHLEATGIDDLDDRIPMHVPCLALLLQPRPMPADLLLRTWLPEQAQAVIAIPRGIR